MSDKWTETKLGEHYARILILEEQVKNLKKLIENPVRQQNPNVFEQARMGYGESNCPTSDGKGCEHEWRDWSWRCKKCGIITEPSTKEPEPKCDVCGGVAEPIDGVMTPYICIACNLKRMKQEPKKLWEHIIDVDPRAGSLTDYGMELAKERANKAINEFKKVVEKVFEYSIHEEAYKNALLKKLEEMR